MLKLKCDREALAIPIVNIKKVGGFVNHAAVKMLELYPSAIADIAQWEEIYSEVTTQTLMPACLKKEFYQRYLALVKDPSLARPITDEALDVAEGLIKTTAMRQLVNASDDEREKALKYVELVWPAYRKKMKQSPSFAKWVFEAGVLFSMYLFRFYVEVDGFLDFDPELLKEINPVTSYQMETAFGRYRDLNGNFGTIPNTDPARWHCVNSELWDTVRFRSPYYVYYMMQAGDTATIVDLCAGALNLERRFDCMIARSPTRKVIAYDSDPHVLEAIADLLPLPLRNYPIEFHNEDIARAFENQDLLGKADLVVMAGGMSYHYERTKDILLGMRSLLKGPNAGEATARCVFDLQLLTPGMGHAKYVLGLGDQHASLHPDMSIDEATARINAILDEINCFEVEEIITDKDFFGADFSYAPTTVLFVLKAK